MKNCLEFIKSIPEYTIKLIYPPRCIFCSKLLELKEKSKMEICKECFSNIPFISNNDIFMKNFFLGTDSLHTGIDKVFSMCEYRGIIKQAIIKYKYFGKVHCYRTFAAIIAKRLRNIIDLAEFDMIISVPLHKRKERSRGYNQSFLISKELAETIGIQEGSHYLVRKKYTDVQSLLHSNDRFLNVKDAFVVTNEDDIKSKSILLVDDVLTTGYTLNECGRILKKAGAKKIYAVVIAASLEQNIKYRT